jgi:uncharacterized membrane protein (UPF0127 family)
MARGRATLTLRREDGRIVCERVRVADTMGRRLRGLLGRKNLGHDEGMLLRPGFSIHTAFMRFPIDVVFLDAELVVLKVDAEVRPFRTSACRGAREVVELRAGECERRGLTMGDRVTWAPLATVDEALDVAAPAAERRGRVIVASRDPRFTKLARFLLDGRGIGVVGTVPVDQLVEELADAEAVDVVVLDAADQLADALRVAGSVGAGHPDVTVVLVGEEMEQSFDATRVFDKWNETEEIMAAVGRALDGADDAPARASV